VVETLQRRAIRIGASLLIATAIWLPTLQLWFRESPRVLGASAGSSGLALVAARSFGDDDFASGLIASLGIGGFPIEDETGLRFAAGNALADAVLLYALVNGPLWERAEVRP